MLTRLHVDNFRCLVNFDLSLDPLCLLLGENGGGKTTVFEILRRLQGFLGGDLGVNRGFPARDLTRWQKLDIQEFELELKIGKNSYLYALSIEHDRDRRARWIRRESLHMGRKPLFEFEDGTARIYDDDSALGAEYPLDGARSGVASLPTRKCYTKLNRFRQQMSKLVVVNLCPMAMTSLSKEEDGLLSPDGSNFASWYRFLSQENQGNIIELTQELRSILPGFDSFSLPEAGEKARMLKVLFHVGSQLRKPTPFNFRELSDGQRQLIVLYCLLYGVKGEGYSLFLDEPDNYVALREIQPWLSSLQDAVGDSISQAVLISHHPEVIDFLAGSSCRWFVRPENGPARVTDKPLVAADGLKMSETIARGWE